jgi:hypothetical protein
MTECEYTRFAWGKVCPKCKTQTRVSDPRSWMARKHAGSAVHAAAATAQRAAGMATDPYGRVKKAAA